ncbi:MAG TPA: glycosyltransferase family 2 protein [Gaiellaceae bacterium]|nr:glycosyltransferase family 2 protein [Gaiellaceae bacterium]HET8653166.1 glycosyltransferase family 2 protein [Gaiellaceae bacterium]
MRSAPELSVIVLCYRAQEGLRLVVEPLHEELRTSGVEYELVLVANYWDGSADVTPQEAESFAAEHSDVVVVARPKGGAMGWDLRSGLDTARGEYLVYLDGDGQVPTEAALQVYRRLKETGAEVAKGRRHVRDDGSVRTLTSLGFNVLFRLLFRTRGLWDVNGQPKGLTRSAHRRLDLRTDDWFTDAEILLKARELGLGVVEVPVHFHSRRAGGSNVGLGTVWEFLVNMVRWRLGRHPAQ